MLIVNNRRGLGLSLKIAGRSVYNYVHNTSFEAVVYLTVKDGSIYGGIAVGNHNSLTNDKVECILPTHSHLSLYLSKHLRTAWPIVHILKQFYHLKSGTDMLDVLPWSCHDLHRKIENLLQNLMSICALCSNWHMPTRKFPLFGDLTTGSFESSSHPGNWHHFVSYGPSLSSEADLWGRVVAVATCLGEGKRKQTSCHTPLHLPKLPTNPRIIRPQNTPQPISHMHSFVGSTHCIPGSLSCKNCAYEVEGRQ